MTYVVVLVFGIVWLYLLHVLKRCNLPAWKFFLGSIGLFIILMVAVRPLVTEQLARYVAACSGFFGKLTGCYEAYFKYGIVYISSQTASITLQVDLECSGIIEIMAFVSLLVFFDVYTSSKKWFVGILGVLGIILANILRITTICFMIYLGGIQVYYIAHAFVGRILFYVLSVILYFYVFTKPQIIRTKVGKFIYGTDK